MESVYGEGFMSPGGATEVIRIVEHIQMDNGRILDLGCGTGGASIALAGHFAACRVTGLDIEPSVRDRARELVDASGFAERIAPQLTQPGDPARGFILLQIYELPLLQVMYFTAFPWHANRLLTTHGVND